MTEAPHFIRLTRALALGALAAPALQCAPTVTQSAQVAHSPAPERASGAQPQSAAPQNNVTPSTPTSSTASAADAPRTGAICELGGTVNNRADGRTLHMCYCQVQGDEPGQLPSRWTCTPHERSVGGLDGQPCEELDADRADADGQSPGNLCVCVAKGARLEYACYRAFNVMAGPLAPPELGDRSAS
jgi:hypothetical protein